MNRSDTSEATNALAGGGELGALMRAHDWTNSPLGPVSEWPQSLLTAVSICLNSRFPMLIWWGPDLVKLYNDAYSVILAGKHPSALGRPGREVWPEIWDIIGPMLDGVISRGEATWSADQLLALHRNGFPEECYFTFSYSPIRVEDGSVGGVFTAVFETSDQVVGERRLRTLSELAARSADAKSDSEACRMSADTLVQNPYDVPFSLLYLFDQDAERAQLSAWTGLEPGGPASPWSVDLREPGDASDMWGLGRLVHTGQGGTLEHLTEKLGPLPGGPWEEPADRAVSLPVIMPGQSRPVGVLVVGVSPRRALDIDYHGFFELLAGHVSTSIANARAYAAERQRAQMLAELDRAKTIFFSNVSHEFRTPLTLLLGPVQDLLSGEQGSLTPAQRESLEIASRNGLRLLRLVNTLLDFSRIEAGRFQATFEPVDLGEYTAHLASNFRSAVERAGLRLEIDTSPLREPVYVDREMWEKIVLNLLSNAFKYTLNGRISVRVFQEGDRARVEVDDTGTGIPEDELPRIFDRFHRVRGAEGRTQEGTGIGLALVQELVHLQGGEIGVSSRIDEGTTFTITLPLGAEHLPADRVRQTAHTGLSGTNAAPFVEEALRWLPDAGRSIDAELSRHLLGPGESLPLNSSHEETRRARILLADDNADMRSYLSVLLGREWDVQATSNGREALHAAQQTPPDLVLSDVMMPGMDGFELLRALRNNPRTASVPVILLSARAGEEAAVEGLRSGADDYLIKPFSARELLARVGAHLQMSRLRSEAARHDHDHNLRLQRLAQASLAINATLSLDGVLKLITQQAREIIGAHQAVTSITSGPNWTQSVSAVSLSDKYSQYRGYSAQPTGEGIYAMVCESNRPVRLTQEELEAHPLWHGTAGDAALHPPLRGWLAAPLTNRDGANLGLIQVSDKSEGDFTEEDENTLVQLAQLASVAIENARLYDAIQAALSVRDEFLSVASHELKTPLTTLTAHTQMMLRRAHLGQQITERDIRSLTVVEEQSRRLRKLIENLLDLSRLQSGRFTGDQAPVDLCALARRVGSEAMSVEDDSRLIEIDCPAEPLMVTGNELLLEQVLQNIVQNALKYSQPGSTVRVHARREGGEAVVSVNDEGIGIPSADLPNLFEPFYRASNTVRAPQSGTGIGLYIVREIVANHHGVVEVDTEEGRGSTFTVRFPLLNSD